MRPYGFHRPDPGIPNEHDKGSERLRTRLELQKALGPVPPAPVVLSQVPATGARGQGAYESTGLAP